MILTLTKYQLDLLYDGFINSIKLNNIPLELYEEIKLFVGVIEMNIPKNGCAQIHSLKFSNDNTKIWKSLLNTLTRSSDKFAPEPFDPNEEDTLSILREDFRLLIVGCSGLGCEILINLALSGFNDIEIVDENSICSYDVKQHYFFRKRLIGQPKSQIAAELVSKRVPGCSIKWYHQHLQELGQHFFKKFNIVISAVDNEETIIWLQNVLCDIIGYDNNGDIDPDTLIPIIHGACHKFTGNIQIIVPTLSACYKCNDSIITVNRNHNIIHKIKQITPTNTNIVTDIVAIEEKKEKLENSIEIFVRTGISGSKNKYNVNADMIVDNFIKKLQFAEGFPKERIVLVFKGKLLKDNKTLKESGIGHGMTVY
eukprot:125779_1